MSFALLALVLPSLSHRALAFAPTADADAEPALREVYHLPAQLRLRHTPAWQEFTAGGGAGWLARFDERDRTVRRAWGPGIDLGPVATAAQVEAALRAWMDANPALVGVSTDELVLRQAGYAADMDTWYVDFDRMLGGAPIWRGGFTARVRGGQLVGFGVRTFPEVQSVPKPAIDADEAASIAQLEGPAALADHTGVTVERVVLPWDRDGGLDLLPCYVVRSHTDAPLGDWVTFVDAVTGRHLATANALRTFSGTLQGTTHTRTLDGSYTTSPFPLAKFSGADGSTVYAAEDGTFSLSDSTTWTAALSGTYVSVRNSNGSNGAMPVSTGSPVWTGSYATQAEIDTYKFVFDVRAWSLETSPDNGMGTEALVAKVNVRGTCNAYYDGSLNFYAEGDGCNNTGQIADVVYHEWGHGFHYYALQAGTYDGSMSEGISDTVATLQTHDSRIGPYFYTSGGAIRDTSTDYVYPEDITGETHQDGLIFAGAVWDLWDNLAATYGESRSAEGTAWRTTSTMLGNALHAGPTIPESYDEFVLADDDNGNVADGTPHLCEILDAFGRHGLGPGGTASLIGIDHAALDNQGANAPIDVSGTVVNLAPGCTEFTLADAAVRYSTDGGSTWSDAPASITGDDFLARLPGFPAGTIVTYYLTAAAADGTEVALPAGADIAPYTFYVGPLEAVWCASFDDDDGGFTHELLDGRNAEGADDWMWDRPSGLSGDPTSAYAGSKIWGNDLGGGNYNGAYQSSIQNRLSSPPIDVGDRTDLVLQYRRWLTVEDGVYDHARVYANDVGLWSNHASSESAGDEQTEDAEWMLHTLRVSGAGSPITLAWEIQSDQGLEFGGWNIDEVCLYAPGAAVPDTGDTGLSGDSAADTAGEGGITVGHSCGCASAPAVPWPAAGLFVALLVTRRRAGERR